MKLLITCFTACLIIFQPLLSPAEETRKISKETSECVECHKDTSPVIVGQWKESKHYSYEVGCYECHGAGKDDIDAFEHGSAIISVIVSPKDCARCHKKEVGEFNVSHHSKGARILGSQDNLLAEVVEGNRMMKTPAFPEGVSSAAVSGCWQCHGSEVKVIGDGRLDPATWPNTGIGRINPDGSEGSCSACHTRHAFSVEQARNPENCGRCHMGPDHPQMEIYDESKHGIAFRAHKERMNLAGEKWVLGEDYNAAPTCATCHMSATKDQNVTHDVGMRISWNNRPVISIRPEVSDAKMGLAGKDIDHKKRRSNMKNVCTNCHNGNYVDAFYLQYDNLVNLYNEKFARPGKELMELAKPLLKPAQFSNKMDFIWFELWHHEGRRARHGASMMGPDYTHWHGTYEVAKRFYTEFIPELEDISAANMRSKDKSRAKQARKLKDKIDEVLNSEDHKWFLNKTDPEEVARRKKAQEEFLKRYGK